ncbi:MAG: ATP-binding protein [Candidatus Woesearchaeota archaeon]
MDVEAIKRYYFDFLERDFSNVISRDLDIIETNKIISVIGPRRVGKSYLFFDKIKKLEQKGISRKQIMYLNFENPVLNDLSYKEIKRLLEIFWSLFPESRKKTYLFIDEPQVIDKWELAVRALYDEFNMPIFITGSSSKLLSKEISTSLRGRTITYELMPLSFKEFLRFKRFNFDYLSTSNKALLLNYINEFLNYGSYPEIVLNNEKDIILKNYFEMFLYDIIERYKLRNTFLIKTLVNLILKSVSKEFSLNKIFNDLKSQGYELSKNTLYEYLSILQDSFFIHPLYRYGLKREEKTLPKIYLNNVGFFNILFEKELGRKLENTIFLKLYSDNLKNYEHKIYYYKDQSNEIDFITKEYAIQVCYDFSDIMTKQREIKSLKRISKKLGKKALLITLDDEKDIDGIKVISLLKFFVNLKLIYL